VSAQHLLPGYIGGNNITHAREVLNQLLEHSDLYAISFYPYMSAFLGNPYPENSFDELLSLSDKPFAVAETGYPAQTFSMDIGNAIITIEGTSDKQDAFIRDLLDAAMSRENTQFVINFVVRDYDQLWVQIGSPIDINIAWRDTGFFDENGNERKSWSTWNEYLNIPYTPLN
jgi:exo-beta-1,3-glucanase (GH17 family)